jgi:hypothetical protein
VEAARHLHVIEVDSETGEVVEPTCEGCQRRDDEITGLERDIRGWTVRFAALKRDKLAEAKGSPEWPVAVRLFAYWQEQTRHPRAVWSLDRFELIAPFLKNKSYGEVLEDREALCRRAIDGYAFDCFTTKRANGSTRRHDDWSLIFRDAGHMEEGVKKAPRETA